MNAWHGLNPPPSGGGARQTWNTQYGQTPNLYAYVVTGAMISVIPRIVAFLSLQRFWRSGLTAGSVKL